MSKTLGLQSAIRRLYVKELTNDQNNNNGLLERLKKYLQRFNSFLQEHTWSSWTIKIAISIAFIWFIWLLIHYYNAFSSNRLDCQFYYARVGVEFKRRQNLIPNLALCVSQYSTHEKDIMKQVSEARKILTGTANLHAKMEAAMMMEGTLSKLLGIVEQYPDLKATETTQTLLKELGNTENRIAEEKMKYNETARKFNNLLTSFPSNIVGYFYGFRDSVPYIATDDDLIKALAIKIVKDQG